nr:MAG TPA: hypothetical protein [Caudoviricetes sp.]
MGILKGIIDRFRANEQFKRCEKPQKHEQLA